MGKGRGSHGKRRSRVSQGAGRPPSSAAAMLREGPTKKRAQSLHGGTPATSPRPEQSPAPSAQSIERLIQNLRTRTPAELARTWKNAVRKIAGQKPDRQWAEASRKVIAAIEAEWLRRGGDRPSVDEYFDWPSTQAPGGDGHLSIDDDRADGMLRYLDYRVGRTNGEPQIVRRYILDRVFASHLPPVFSEAYMREWGQPSSSGRLKKLAECLASFTRNAKRRDEDLMGEAIREWEDDLLYLHDKYYVGVFNFVWPSSTPDWL